MHEHSDEERINEILSVKEFRIKSGGQYFHRLIISHHESQGSINGLYAHTCFLKSSEEMCSSVSLSPVSFSKAFLKNNMTETLLMQLVKFSVASKDRDPKWTVEKLRNHECFREIFNFVYL